jgi:hypothetical protein
MLSTTTLVAYATGCVPSEQPRCDQTVSDSNPAMSYGDGSIVLSVLVEANAFVPMALTDVAQIRQLVGN